MIFYCHALANYDRATNEVSLKFLETPTPGSIIPLNWEEGYEFYVITKHQMTEDATRIVHAEVRDRDRNCLAMNDENETSIVILLATVLGLSETAREPA